MVSHRNDGPKLPVDISSSANALDTQPTPMELEYRRRRTRVFRFVMLCALLPFGLEMLFVYVSAPPLLLSAGMAATMIGIVASNVYIWRVWKCPACGFKLWVGGKGTLGGKCLGCGTQLYVPRRSKSGRVYP